MIETMAIARAAALSNERPPLARHELPRVPRRPSRLALRLRALLRRRPATSTPCPGGACA